jgi:predicted membrane protein
VSKQLSNTGRRNLMSLMSLVAALILVGILLWVVNTYVPMDGKIKNILNAVVVVAVVIGVLSAFGVFSALNVSMPRLGGN